MKKINLGLLLLLLTAIPVVTFAHESNPDMDKLQERGWHCELIPPVDGDWHCFDPGDARSKNQGSVNVLVFDGDKHFYATEILWLKYNGGQGCPADELLDLGFAFACHHHTAKGRP